MNRLAVAIAVLFAAPAFAEDASSSASDCAAALSEDSILVAGMKQREEQLAVQLARAQKEIAQLKADAEKTKAPPLEGPKP